MCVCLFLTAVDVGTTNASVTLAFGLPCVRTSWSLDDEAVTAGGGGGGGGGKDGGGGNEVAASEGPGDNDKSGGSSSFKKSKRFSSNGVVGSPLSVLTAVVGSSFENPEATSSSCCTGCLGRSGKKYLFPVDEVEVELAEAVAAVAFTIVTVWGLLLLLDSELI